MKMMMRRALRAVAAVVMGAFIGGCGASSDPALDDERDFEERVDDEESVGAATLELTSVSYSTYLGGSGDQTATGAAVDKWGNAYVVGTTTVSGSSDVFVAKLSPTGALIYYVSFSGPGQENAGGIAVDSLGNAYVTGTTLPAGASQDIFVAKLNAAGSALTYFSYFGGSDVEFGGSIAIDAAGNAYVTGATDSADFPTTGGSFQTTRRGQRDAFVTKLNAAGNALVYSTYLGGDEDDYGSDIAVDAYGYAYVTGETAAVYSAPSFPTTPGAFQTTFGGGRDAFVTELVPSGAALFYSTYLGGSGHDAGHGIAVDGSYNAYVTGFTTSTNLPTTPGAYRTSHTGGWSDGFVTKLDAWGSGAYYSTYLGSSSNDTGFQIAVSSAGNAYVTGYTSGWDFPTTPGAFRTSQSWLYDAFVTQLNKTGTSLSYSTYVGGTGDDSGQGLAVDPSGNVYVAGLTTSTNFPTVSAIQPVKGGGNDAFVLKISGP